MARMTRAERMARMEQILARQAEEKAAAARVANLEAGLGQARRKRTKVVVDRIAAAANVLYTEIDALGRYRRVAEREGMEQLKARAGKKRKSDAEDKVVAYRGGAPVGQAAEAIVRRDSLAELFRTGAIDQFQHAAGVTIRALWVAKDGGARSPDPTMIKVDGGGRIAEAIRLGALAASRELRRILTAARLGEEEAEIVVRVCGESQTVMAVAIRLEDNAAMLRNGGCSKETADRVKFSLKRSLRFIANVIHGRPARGPVHPYQDDRVLAWLDAEARPADLAKRA